MTAPGPTASDEIKRIRSVYEERDRSIPWERYSVVNAGSLLGYQLRARDTARLLAREGFFPLTDVTVLDVGCGTGGWLVELERWGAQPANLAGIDVDADRVARAGERLTGLDVRLGDGLSLPWPDGSFALVAQSTVFTSILDDGVRTRLATEMARVLAPDGAILWYDFFRDNPRNPDVRAVRKDELTRLFPEFDLSLRRVTVAPPLMRRLAPISWTAATFLETLRLTNCYYLGFFRRSAP